MVAKFIIARIVCWAGVAAALICLQTATAVADNEAAEAAYDRGDYDSAMVQWLAEADRGDATAQYNVATLLRLGRGGAPNPKASAVWYRAAAEQGHLAAQINLGRLYLAGAGEI